MGDPAFEIKWKEKVIQLPRKTSLILRLLATHPNQILSRSVLTDLKSGEDEEPDNVAVHICKIRRAFEAVDPGFAKIVSRRYFGYMWKEEETSVHADSIQFGRLEYDQDTETLFWDGQPVSLQPSAQKILLEMVAHPGRFKHVVKLFAVRKNNEYSASGDDDVSYLRKRDVVSVQVSNIRRAFRKIDPDFNQIQNAWLSPGNSGFFWRRSADSNDAVNGDGCALEQDAHTNR
jgi:DNA-binding response OmpR family regulator